jgi:hypothetical protein
MNVIQRHVMQTHSAPTALVLTPAHAATDTPEAAMNAQILMSVTLECLAEDDETLRVISSQPKNVMPMPIVLIWMVLSTANVMQVIKEMASNA